MTKDQYRTAIAALGWSQRKAAASLGFAERTSRADALGETPVPPVVQRCLELEADNRRLRALAEAR